MGTQILTLASLILLVIIIALVLVFYILTLYVLIHNLYTQKLKKTMGEHVIIAICEAWKMLWG